jgi:hypothetical protein
MNMLEIKNDLDEILFIELDCEVPYVTIRKGVEFGKTYHLKPNDVSSIKNHFGDYISLPSLSLWLERESKEIVTKEDMESMLGAVKFCIMDCNKRANAAVEAANRLSELYNKYSKGEDNEGRA